MESAWKVYCFKTVLFGSNSSPFVLNSTLHHHLENFKTPFAKNVENIYVHNFQIKSRKPINHD